MFFSEHTQLLLLNYYVVIIIMLLLLRYCYFVTSIIEISGIHAPFHSRSRRYRFVTRDDYESIPHSFVFLLEVAACGVSLRRIKSNITYRRWIVRRQTEIRRSNKRRDPIVPRELPR